MNSKMFKFAILALSVFVFSIGIVNADCVNPSLTTVKVLSVNWGNSTNPIAVNPGSQDVPLTVSLESYGNTCTLSNIEGIVQLYGNGFRNFNGNQTPTYFIQSAAAYSIFNMVFHLNIANNISVGPNAIYTYPLYIAWNYSTNSTERNTQEFNIPIPMAGSPNLFFTIPNPNLIPGQINNITIKVSNQGSGTATYISTPISSSSSGLNLISQPQTITSLGPGSSANVSFSAYVSPTLAGNQATVSLSPHYINPYGYNTSSSTSIGLYVISAEGGINIGSSSQTLVQGEVNNISIKVTNTGKLALRNVSVTFTPSTSLSIIGSDGVATIPIIQPGANVNVPISLYATPSSSSTVSSLTITLAYSAGSISRTLSFLTPGYINMTTVSTTVLPSAPSKGEIFSLTSNLDNIGSETAYAVTIYTHPPSGISVVGENTTFLGDIAAYTPTAFSLSFVSSSSAASGKYVIPVTISYLNNINQKLNTTFYYTVNIGSSGFNGTSTGSGVVVTRGGNFTRSGNGSPSGTYYRSSSSGLPLLPIAVVIVLVGGGCYLFLRWRKGKEKKAHQNENKGHNRSGD